MIKMATPARFIDHRHLVVLSVVADEYRNRYVGGGPIPHEVSFGLLGRVLEFEERKPKEFREMYRVFRAKEGLERRTRDFAGKVQEVVTALETAGKPVYLYQYDRETTTCSEKEKMWKEQGFQKQFPSGLGMIKSVLFKYAREGEERYILACTTSNKTIDLGELRVEFGLSGSESRTLTHRGIDETDLTGIVGQELGEVSPLLVKPNVEELDGIYFTADLMTEARGSPQKMYDVPLTHEAALLANAADLFSVLRDRSSKYRTDPKIEIQLYGMDALLKVTEWKVQEDKDPHSEREFRFDGTVVKFRGQEYVIKNPRSKECIATIPRERNEEGLSRRVMLPIDYGTMARFYEQR